MWTPSVGKRQPDLAPAGRRLTDRDRHPHDRQRDGQFGDRISEPVIDNLIEWVEKP